MMQAEDTQDIRLMLYQDVKMSAEDTGDIVCRTAALLLDFSSYVPVVQTAELEVSQTFIGRRIGTSFQRKSISREHTSVEFLYCDSAAIRF